MATSVVDGATNWSLQRDSEGHREYKITFLVKGEKTDGPANAIRTPGLPLIGQSWFFDNDRDIWAWCRPETTVTPRRANEPNNYFDVEFTFSTKPLKKCSEYEIENPLLEPQKISGSFVKYTEEAVFDRFNRPIVSSSFELYSGQIVEFDKSKAAVRIEQNVALLNLPLLSSMIHTVNTAPLWGMNTRCVKLGQITWERKFYGQCGIYYTRTFDFEIDPNTFDKETIDKGYKALSGHWNGNTWQLDNINGQPPDPYNPSHYNEYLDRNGNPGKVILNGAGIPAETIFDLESGTGDSGSPGRIIIQKYHESNFLLLGIPTIF